MLPRCLLPGMSGAYSRAKDPFILYDLSQPSPVRDYARYFYNQVGRSAGPRLQRAQAGRRSAQAVRMVRPDLQAVGQGPSARLACRAA